MPDAAPRILVVEDDPGLLDLIARYLGRLGYQVRACATGHAAREAIAAGETYAVALLDVALPDTNGQDLARELAGVAHPPNVVLMSGFTIDTLDPELRDRVSFLQKPFTPFTLAATVADALQ